MPVVCLSSFAFILLLARLLAALLALLLTIDLTLLLALHLALLLTLFDTLLLALLLTPLHTLILTLLIIGVILNLSLDLIPLLLCSASSLRALKRPLGAVLLGAFPRLDAAALARVDDLLELVVRARRVVDLLVGVADVRLADVVQRQAAAAVLVRDVSLATHGGGECGCV